MSAPPREGSNRGRRTRRGCANSPALDGLRGLAVAAVIIYHFFGGVLPGGYLGVDMFFVLSGFLITSLLVREFDVTGGISLREFWVRRFRRILPAAVMVLAICTALVGAIGGDIAVNLREQFFGTLFSPTTGSRSRPPSPISPTTRSRSSPTTGPWPWKNSSTCCGR